MKSGTSRTHRGKWPKACHGCQLAPQHCQLAKSKPQRLVLQWSWSWLSIKAAHNVRNRHTARTSGHVRCRRPTAAAPSNITIPHAIAPPRWPAWSARKSQAKASPSKRRPCLMLRQHSTPNTEGDCKGFGWGFAWWTTKQLSKRRQGPATFRKLAVRRISNKIWCASYLTSGAN